MKKTRRLLLIMMAAAAFEPLWPQGNKAPNVLRVVVTHHGIRLRPARAKAGPVRVLLDNRTLLDGTAISIGAEPPNASPPLKRMVLPEKALIRKSWHDAVLPPGRYRVWIEKAREVWAVFTVEP